TRKGIKEVLSEEKKLHVKWEAKDGKAAFELIEAHQPNLAILDIDMPGLNGLEVIAAVQKQNWPVKCIILTMYDRESMFRKALEFGAMGYVMKDSAVLDIAEAALQVLDGKHYISPALSGFLIAPKNEQKGKSGLDSLTPSELKILKLISQSQTTQIIAESLFISARTVDTHRSNICSKLGLKGTNSLVRFAFEHKKLL
ncbi:MAG: response regulator transcription factor, partial [Balneolaceae bacterium]